MTRTEFERALVAQNAARDAEVAKARETGSPCDVETMLAFGGVEFCRAHRVMGPCPYAKPAAPGAPFVPFTNDEIRSMATRGNPHARRLVRKIGGGS